MKCHYIPAIGTALLLSSCSQPAPQSATRPGTAPGYALPNETAHNRQYLALPGQSARAVAPTDTDAAFERQAAAYATGATAPPVANDSLQTSAFPGSLPAASADAAMGKTDNAGIPATAPFPARADHGSLAADSIPEPQPLHDPAAENAPLGNAASAAAPATQPKASYAVQVKNGTPGRLYIEMQDDAGNIFPIAFMHSDQAISTPPQEPKPIVGKLTVVIRDPDQPGAPELRRYKVEPPADYMGKTIGITILPRGQYRASLDGDVYYVSPAPTPPGQR